MEDFKYEKLTLGYCDADNTFTVISCDKDAIEVTIPDYVNNIPVIAIAENAFLGCDKLVSVTVPDNREVYYELDALTLGFEILDQAFAECKALKTVNLTESVSHIGHGAFRDCPSLEEIYIPDCYVGPYAFYRCASLKTVNPIDIISEGVFGCCESLEVFPVKEGTDTISEDAFEHCYALTDIVIPASVRRIEPLAFRNCHGLKTVTFADPEDWYGSSRYTMKDCPIDVLDPTDNAQALKQMDFDDGCGGWFKKSADEFEDDDDTGADDDLAEFLERMKNGEFDNENITTDDLLEGLGIKPKKDKKD